MCALYVLICDQSRISMVYILSLSLISHHIIKVLVKLICSSGLLGPWTCNIGGKKDFVF